MKHFADVQSRIENPNAADVERLKSYCSRIHHLNITQLSSKSHLLIDLMPRLRQHAAAHQSKPIYSLEPPYCEIFQKLVVEPPFSLPNLKSLKFEPPLITGSWNHHTPLLEVLMIPMPQLAEVDIALQVTVWTGKESELDECVAFIKARKLRTLRIWVEIQGLPGDGSGELVKLPGREEEVLLALFKSQPELRSLRLSRRVPSLAVIDALKDLRELETLEFDAPPSNSDDPQDTFISLSSACPRLRALTLTSIDGTSVSSVFYVLTPSNFASLAHLSLQFNQESTIEPNDISTLGLVWPNLRSLQLVNVRIPVLLLATFAGCLDNVEALHLGPVVVPDDLDRADAVEYITAPFACLTELQMDLPSLPHAATRSLGIFLGNLCSPGCWVDVRAERYFEDDRIRRIKDVAMAIAEVHSRS